MGKAEPVFPIMLDLKGVPVAVAGESPAAARRVTLLDAAGADRLTVFAPDPGPDMVAAAQGRLERRWPQDPEVAALTVLFTADLPDALAERLATIARTNKVLVNTEDVRPLCDFHVPSMVRRGDLLFTISTNGKSPGLARRLRRDFEARFGPEWAERLEEIARARETWRAAGLSLPEVSKCTEALLAEKGWLP